MLRDMNQRISSTTTGLNMFKNDKQISRIARLELHMQLDYKQSLKLLKNKL